MNSTEEYDSTLKSFNELVNKENQFNQFDQRRLKEIIQSGRVNGRLSKLCSSVYDQKQKKQAIIDAIKEMSKDQLMEIGKFKNLLKSLPPEFIKEKKQDLVNIQSELGKEIKSKKNTGKKSGIMADSFQRMKNILKMGYIPEEQKSTRTRYIDRQKAIGEAIRSSRVKRVMNAAHAIYNKATKKSGRSL
ncbi:MAG: hypothetical protein N4A31_02825 [Rickettsiales bacterium]|jgi:hypothetical protein|nr:hypothetical protein [Rickettsiales bacterium]